MSLDRDYEQKLASLERKNLDLKMQIYYLNQKQSEVGAASPEKLSNTEASLNFRIQSLMEEVTAGNRRITELETELMENSARILQEDKNDSRSSMSHNKFDLETMEENRIREREAAALIQEQDALIIEGMEIELRKLQTLHDKDLTMLKDLSEKIGRLQQEKSEINELLISEIKKSEKLQQQIGIMTDQNRRQDLLLQRNQIGDHTTKSDLDNPLTSIDAVRVDHNEKQKENFTVNTEGIVSEVTPKDFLDFGAQTAWEELHTLRKENYNLKSQLKREREHMKTQEDALKRVQASAEEITLLEAEEIARLEKEIDRCTDEKQQWQQTAQKLQDQLNILHAKFNFDENEERMLENQVQVEDKVLLQSVSSPIPMGIDRDDGAAGISVLSAGLEPQVGPPMEMEGPIPQSTIGGGSMRSSEEFKENSSPSQQKKPFKQPTNKLGYSYFTMMENQKTAEIYRLREAELLRALEGVVIRCQELEAQVTMLTNG